MAMAIGRLTANIGGPSECQRRIYTSVVLSVVLYGPLFGRRRLWRIVKSSIVRCWDFSVNWHLESYEVIRSSHTRQLCCLRDRSPLILLLIDHILNEARLSRGMVLSSRKCWLLSAGMRSIDEIDREMGEAPWKTFSECAGRCGASGGKSKCVDGQSPW